MQMQFHWTWLEVKAQILQGIWRREGPPPPQALAGAMLGWSQETTRPTLSRLSFLSFVCWGQQGKAYQEVKHVSSFLPPPLPVRIWAKA